MSRIAHKARLRNTLRKLDAARRAASDPGDRAEAAQEALDCLAMLTGLKPVLLIGRGFDDPQWIRGVLQIALDRKLYMIEGPYWDASPEEDDDELPAWFLAQSRAAFSEFRAHYICRARVVAE